MPKKSDLVRHAEAQIKLLEINIRKYREAIIRAEAEIKAYENLIDWSKNVRPANPNSTKKLHKS